MSKNEAISSKKIGRRVLAVLAVAFALLLVACVAYLASYSRPDDHALKCLESGNGVSVVDLEDGDIAFLPDESRDESLGLVLYPGGKVGYRSYAPLARACAERGITTVIVRMPANLAFFDVDAAARVPVQLPGVKSWYIGGHSLGGVAAAMFAEENADAFDGLILLASYSTKDLTDEDLPVLCIHGSEDGVLAMDKHDEALGNLSVDGLVEMVIPGGNHALFGCYGEQKGDGDALITEEEQIEETVSAVESFVKR